MAKNKDGMLESTGKIKLTGSDYVIRGIGKTLCGYPAAERSGH